MYFISYLNKKISGCNLARCYLNESIYLLYTRGEIFFFFLIYHVSRLKLYFSVASEIFSKIQDSAVKNLQYSKENTDCKRKIFIQK